MLRAILVFSILLPGLCLALFSTFAALLLYLWYALFYPQEWVWFDLNAFHFSLLLGALVVIPSILKGQFPDLRHRLSVGMLLFLGTALLAQHNAADPATGWLWLDYLSRLILICLLAVRIIDTRRRFHLTVIVLGLSFGVHSAVNGFASFLAGGQHITEGGGGVWSGNDGFAIGTLMVVFLLIGAAQLTSTRVARWLLFVMVPACVMAVIFTFSRGGFLALVVSFLAFAVLQKRLVLAVGGLSLAVVLGLAVVPVPSEYVDRLHTIRTYEEVGDDSALGRIHFWRVALEMAKDNPMGVGLRNYEAAYDKYDFLQGRFGTERAVHSAYFQVLAETGFAGLAIYLLLFVSAGAILLRVRRRAYSDEDDRRFFVCSANALLCSMIGFLVGGAFLSLALNDLSWLTFSLVAVLDRLSKAAVFSDGAARASSVEAGADFADFFRPSPGAA